MRLLLLAVLAGCTSSPTSGADSGTCPARPDGGDRCGSDPAYVYFPPLPPDTVPDAAAATDGGASDLFFTDEACRAFLDQEAQGLVSYDTTSRTPTIAAPADGAQLPGGTPPTLSWTKGPGATLMQRALDWLEPSAFAHGITTGDGYILEFTSGCDEVLRVMLQATTYTPDADSWTRLKAAKGPIALTVVWVKWVDNAVASGLAPAASKPVTFTIGP